ncbi:calcium/sodium antiporter [Photobacterium sp. DNB23_23_1]|uniref:Calcium/sodium antiporter n=1 Tax=Photobacterium pectinilyticum TaxID=2906793 RepID=A0ABT1N382_9GAMM|nr:calcium/sodium antiporter [Photobacterium sp. ZSDE20]MCQ1059170.1 calcium/sodium antiporter [Photobacterium sp. ZSDE20]MDD1824822.1 calcium/sodium antiporter [Photobacterium sp. ZSDE20]
MNAFLLALSALTLGFVFLSFSADRLIASSATFAKHCNISIAFIGMTVVAFGTSAPELLVSATAAINGAGELSVGNGLGSNIINIGLVISVCILFKPLFVHSRFIRREYPILAITMMLSCLLMLNGKLAIVEGAILLSGLLVYCLYLAYSVKHEHSEPEELDFLNISKARAALESIIMLVILLTSSKLMVWGAVELAVIAGISELTIGLTVIAFGTSLPELAAALAAVKRGMHDIAFATVIGSNIFNLLGVIAFPALIDDGLTLPPQILSRDLPVMALLTAVLGGMLMFAVAKQRFTSNTTASYQVSRVGGGLLLIIFITYMWYIASSIV